MNKSHVLRLLNADLVAYGKPPVTLDDIMWFRANFDVLPSHPPSLVVTYWDRHDDDDTRSNVSYTRLIALPRFYSTIDVLRAAVGTDKPISNELLGAAVLAVAEMILEKED